MPDFINAVETQDNYVEALTLDPAPWTKLITFSVLPASGDTIANPVLATFAKYAARADGSPNFSQEPVWEPYERLYVGNTIGAITNEWAGGVKFRSATVGQPATIAAERDFQSDIIVTAANVTSATVSASGQTGNTVNILGANIAANGSINYGSKITCSHPQTGSYVLSWAAGLYSVPPSVGVEPQSSWARSHLSSGSTTGFTVNWTDTSNAAVDIAFVVWVLPIS